MTYFSQVFKFAIDFSINCENCGRFLTAERRPVITKTIRFLLTWARRRRKMKYNEEKKIKKTKCYRQWMQRGIHDMKCKRKMTITMTDKITIDHVLPSHILHASLHFSVISLIISSSSSSPPEQASSFSLSFSLQKSSDSFLHSLSSWWWTKRDANQQK